MMTGLNVPINLPPFPLSGPGLGDGLEHDESSHRIHTVIFPADYILFTVGSPRQYAYLIERGEVVLKDARGIELCRLGAGDIFGEMALIDEGARTASAMTAGETEVFVIPRDALHDRVIGLDPVLSLLIGLLIDRYRAARIAMPESFIPLQGAAGIEPSGLSAMVDIRSRRIAALHELTLEKKIRQGLERAEFVPVLQPIIRMRDRRLVGFESLIRWYSPENGLIFPDQFIPVTERVGMVQLLDKTMLDQVCRLIPGFVDRHPSLPDDFFISVNLSGVNFATLDILNYVRDALSESNIAPHHLKFEITESALITDPEKARRILAGLRALGVTIALDDFGTGYSSLGYLHQFSLDSLKIDRSFIRQIHDSKKSLMIVSAMIGLAQNFKLNVIAEGIETEQDADVIRRLGCEMAQGYLFGKPMSSDDAEDFIEKNTA